MTDQFYDLYARRYFLPPKDDFFLQVKEPLWIQAKEEMEAEVEFFIAPVCIFERLRLFFQNLILFLILGSSKRI